MLRWMALLWILMSHLALADNSNEKDLWIEDQFKLANGPGAIGETGHLYLIGQGLFIRPFYNDIFGKTDKHLSGSTQVGWMQTWSDSSLEFRGHWRFLTPGFKSEFGDKPLDLPIGRYADWMESQFAYSFMASDLRTMPLKFQFSLGLGHVGDKGAKQIHHKIHEWVGSSLEGLEYINQPDGRYFSRGAEISTFSETRILGYKSGTMLSLGVSYNKFMTDIYSKLNQITEISSSISLSYEIKGAFQVASGVYDNSEPFRYEAALGLRWGFYRPSIKYVSNFLRGDRVGQIYFDPLAVYFSF